MACFGHLHNLSIECNNNDLPVGFVLDAENAEDKFASLEKKV